MFYVCLLFPFLQRESKSYRLDHYCILSSFIQSSSHISYWLIFNFLISGTRYLWKYNSLQQCRICYTAAADTELENRGEWPEEDINALLSSDREKIS